MCSRLSAVNSERFDAPRLWQNTVLKAVPNARLSVIVLALKEVTE